MEKKRNTYHDFPPTFMWAEKNKSCVLTISVDLQRLLKYFNKLSTVELFSLFHFLTN